MLHWVICSRPQLSPSSNTFWITMKTAWRKETCNPFTPLQGDAKGTDWTRSSFSVHMLMVFTSKKIMGSPFQTIKWKPKPKKKVLKIYNLSDSALTLCDKTTLKRTEMAPRQEHLLALKRSKWKFSVGEIGHPEYRPPNSQKLTWTISELIIQHHQS